MDVLEIFKDSPKARRVAAGEVLFRRGDAANEMYVVLEGQVDVSLDGRLVESLPPGSILGEMGIVDHSPRSADAVAASDAKIEVIDRDWFCTLIKRAPQFGLHVMSVMAARLRRHMQQAA